MPSPIPQVPGVPIFHIPASTGQFIGSPGLAVLPDGTYIAKCDLFGPASSERESGLTRVFVSRDRGQTWSRAADVHDMYWASIFAHGDALYLLGTTKEYGHVAIARSDDAAQTWTAARDGILRDGSLRNGSYHCAPMPVIIHQGRLWRAFEHREPAGGWAENLRAVLLTAPADADLLQPANWTNTTSVPSDRAWNNGDFQGWLEGNAVVNPEGDLVDVLRVAVEGARDKVAIVHVDTAAMTTSFDPATDLIDFPGGATKFTIRFDPASNLYWSLANIVPPAYQGNPLTRTRNTLALTTSPDLRHWTPQSIILFHPDRPHHGFQYVDWLFEGDDIILASRTAFDDDHGGARNLHDANYLTFHRIPNFRHRTLRDAALNDPAATGYAVLGLASRSGSE